MYVYCEDGFYFNEKNDKSILEKKKNFGFQKLDFIYKSFYICANPE